MPKEAVKAMPPVDVSPLKRRDKDPLLPFTFVVSYLVHLKGRVLTAVDASIPAGPQNKAAKDVIKWSFDECYQNLLNSIPLPDGQSWSRSATLGNELLGVDTE